MVGRPRAWSGEFVDFSKKKLHNKEIHNLY
jgi:hypothetical protein